ncbi:MAG: threonine--tRNA ligase [Candidatus Liptonbacteria bacterium]|nr:threonine--tRNA ligase [Candidatus Liptonbacteria bacterium]
MLNLENIRHSLAHLLAAAVLKKYPKTKLGIGPTIEEGFYYDFLLPAGKKFSPDDLKEFEKTMRELIKQNLLFSGKKVTAAEAKKLFADQQFKLDLIKEFSKEAKQLSVYYTCPPKTSNLSPKTCFMDLCRGGHVKSTKEIHADAFRLTKIAGAYWRGDEKNPQLQRIYGVAFKTKKELEDYLKLQEEIEKRDHRKIGERLELFSFEEVSQGAPFWHGKGMIVFRELEKFIREEQDKAGYEETSTPIMVKKEIFEKSGHWQFYRENIFHFKEGDDTLVLKPMNCPESTYIYNSRTRSYKDLPLRLSEIGRLHRNERSGTLGGLFRVRQITMDDAHIYCRRDQIQSEISSLLKLAHKVYKIFGFEERFYLATKPAHALGDVKLWQEAEKALVMALKENKVKFEIAPKDGAFYGPKIDIHIKDALGRDWQLATIQLDLVMLPERFNLAYIDEKGKKQRPVVIHRAILGSFERFIGILLEHFAGALPLWLAPVQVAVLPVGEKFESYGRKVYDELKTAGIRAELSTANETLGKRIREAEMQKIPYILVVGEKEEEAKNVNVRHYKRGQEREITIGKFLAKIREEIEKKAS